MVWSSADGISWTAAAPGDSALSAVLWNGSQYVASGLGLYTSADGTAWTSIPTSVAGYSVAWSGSNYLFLLNTFARYLKAADLTPANPPLLTQPTVWGQLIWASDQWVAPGDPGFICTSP